MGRKDVLKGLWLDLCTVTVKAEYTDPITKITDFKETVLFENEPCKLSFNSLTVTGGDEAPSAAQDVKLFISSDLEIPAGSKITVTRGGRTFEYARSGEPGIFTHHQEIRLEKFERWA